jgi:hypothetical protein
MQYVLIAAIATLALLIALVTLAVFWMADEVRGQIRRRTAELITLYDGLEARDREEEWQDEDIEFTPGGTPRTAQANQAAQASAGPAGQDQGAGGQTASAMLNVTEQISSASYLSRELPIMYREVRSQFYFNPAQLLRTLPIADLPRDESGPATRLLRQIDYETAFSMSQLAGADQYGVMQELAAADANAHQLLEEYGAAGDRFDVLAFCDFLSLKSVEEPHPITLYVPADMLQYRAFSEGISVVADEDICDGVQIEADNIIYDFAVKGREIS